MAFSPDRTKETFSIFGFYYNIVYGVFNPCSFLIPSTDIDYIHKQWDFKVTTIYNLGTVCNQISLLYNNNSPALIIFTQLQLLC
jgi:hypothetical protein